MVRGTTKRVIYLKNTGSPYFDEAYFIVRARAAKLDEGAMIREASRIADEGLLSTYTSINKKRRLKPSMSAFIAFISGAAAVGLAVLFTILL